MRTLEKSKGVVSYPKFPKEVHKLIYTRTRITTYNTSLGKPPIATCRLSYRTSQTDAGYPKTKMKNNPPKKDMTDMVRSRRQANSAALHGDGADREGLDAGGVEAHQVADGVPPDDGAQLLVGDDLGDDALGQALLGGLGTPDPRTRVT